MKKILSISLALSVFGFSSFGQKLVQGYQSRIIGKPYHSLAADLQGNIFVYQYFDHLNGAYIGNLAKIDATGNFIPGFSKLFTDGVVSNVGVQKDGKIVISGTFTTVNGNVVPNLLRLNEDGTIDPTFHSSLVSKATDFKFQSDGRIIVRTDNGLVRLNTDGSLDSNFSMRGYFYSGSPMEVGPDDYIYISSYSRVHKLMPDGQDDTSFFVGDGVNESHITSIKVQADGKILVSGYFTSYNGYAARSLVRLLANGQVDTGFNVGIGPEGQIFEIVERQNKNLLIAGQFTLYNNQLANLVELKPDGSLHRIIAVVTTNWITSIIETPDEHITIGGEFTEVNNMAYPHIVRFRKDYTINSAFKPQITYTNANSRFLHARTNGTVVTGGSTEFMGILQPPVIKKTQIAQLDPFGRYDAAYSPVIAANYPYITASLMQDDEKMILTGFVREYNGPTMIRYNVDGTTDNTFNIGKGPTTATSNAAMVYGMLQHEDIIFLGGNFEKFNGISSQSLVAIHKDGSIAKTFSIFPPGTHIHGVALQSGGQMIVIGHLPFPGGSKSVVRINSDGSLDHTFGITSISANLALVKVDDQDRIYLGGSIFTVNGAIVSDVVRLLPSGDLDMSFDTGTGFGGSDYIRVIEMLPGGNIAVGGYFNRYNDIEANGFVILDESGAMVPTPLVRLGKNSIATAADYSGGALFLAGRFVYEQYTDVYGTVKINIDAVTAPVGPDILNAELYSAGGFQLSWSDNSTNELAFVVERSEKTSENFVAVDTVFSNATTAVDKKIVSGVKYFYRVKAINDEGPSPHSNITSIVWIQPPVAQLNLTVTEYSETEFLLTWQGTVSGHDGFIVERSETSLSEYATIDTVSSDTYSYIDKVEVEKTYHYRVAAYNTAGRVASNHISSIISGIRESVSHSLYPLPAKDFVYTNAGNHGKGEWYLVATTGETIPVHGQPMNDVTELDVHRAPSGVYLLQYREGNKQMFTTRIIILR